MNCKNQWYWNICTVFHFVHFTAYFCSAQLESIFLYKSLHISAVHSCRAFLHICKFANFHICTVALCTFHCIFLQCIVVSGHNWNTVALCKFPPELRFNKLTIVHSNCLPVFNSIFITLQYVYCSATIVVSAILLHFLQNCVLSKHRIVHSDCLFSHQPSSSESVLTPIIFARICLDMNRLRPL